MHPSFLVKLNHPRRGWPSPATPRKKNKWGEGRRFDSAGRPMASAKPSATQEPRLQATLDAHVWKNVVDACRALSHAATFHFEKDNGMVVRLTDNGMAMLAVRLHPEAFTRHHTEGASLVLDLLKLEGINKRIPLNKKPGDGTLALHQGVDGGAGTPVKVQAAGRTWSLRPYNGSVDPPPPDVSLQLPVKARVHTKRLLEALKDAADYGCDWVRMQATKEGDLHISGGTTNGAYEWSAQSAGALVGKVESDGPHPTLMSLSPATWLQDLVAACPTPLLTLQWKQDHPLRITYGLLGPAEAPAEPAEDAEEPAPVVVGQVEYLQAPRIED